MIKVRQQLLLSRSGPAAIAKDAASAAAPQVKANFYSLGREMARREGVLSLWSGVTASCLRELSYSTIRMGGYETCKVGMLKLFDDLERNADHTCSE